MLKGQKKVCAQHSFCLICWSSRPCDPGRFWPLEVSDMFGWPGYSNYNGKNAFLGFSKLFLTVNFWVSWRSFSVCGGHLPVYVSPQFSLQDLTQTKSKGCFLIFPSPFLPCPIRFSFFFHFPFLGLGSNSWVSCLSPPSAAVTGLLFHTW